MCDGILVGLLLLLLAQLPPELAGEIVFRDLHGAPRLLGHALRPHVGRRRGLDQHGRALLHLELALALAPLEELPLLQVRAVAVLLPELRRTVLEVRKSCVRTHVCVCARACPFPTRASMLPLTCRGRPVDAQQREGTEGRESM